MTNPTPHGQVPEALIDLIDAYAETRHRCGGIYNARTEAARKAVIEALSGVQALSAAPAAKKSALRTYPNPIVPLIKPVSEQEKMRALYLASSNLMAYLGRNGAIHSDGHAADAMMDCLNDLDGGGFDETLFAASPTPPAEQQATKETSGGFHVWRDISTAPKDGSRFVATGHNYGLYSEVRHTCVAQWFRGCWMEASDWNETSELKYLTHWMPLPSPPDDVAAPAEQQAAPKAAPGVGNSGFDHQTAADFLSGKTVSDEAVRKFVQASRWAHDEKASLSAMLLSVRGELASREAEIALLKKALLEAEAAPQQEAQEPCPTCVALARTVMLDQVSFDRKPDCYGIRQITDDEGVEEWEDIRTSPDVAREEANDMMSTGRGEIYEVVPLYTAPLPAPDCHHRPPCDECAAYDAQGGKV